MAIVNRKLSFAPGKKPKKPEPPLKVFETLIQEEVLRTDNGIAKEILVNQLDPTKKYYLEIERYDDRDYGFIEAKIVSLTKSVIENSHYESQLLKYEQDLKDYPKKLDKYKNDLEKYELWKKQVEVEELAKNLAKAKALLKKHGKS
jgi:hypothetical protein